MQSTIWAWLGVCSIGVCLALGVAFGQTGGSTGAAGGFTQKCVTLNPNNPDRLSPSSGWNLCATWKVTTVDIVFTAPSNPGWAAFGIGEKVSMMWPSGIVAQLATSNDVDYYQATGYFAPIKGQNNYGFTNKAATTNPDGSVTISFTAPVDGSLITNDGDANIIYARGSYNGGMVQHNGGGSGNFQKQNFISGASSIDNTMEHYRAAHGIMMCFAWGLFIPLGIMAARYFKPIDPSWFIAHRVLVMLGLAIAFAAWIIGLVKIADGNHPTHRALGITAMSLGLAQPFIAAVRPHPPSPGEKPTTLRRVWQFVHHWVGRVAYVIAIVNVFFGLSYYNTDAGKINTNTIAFLVCWLVVMALGISLEIRSHVVTQPEAAAGPASKHMPPPVEIDGSAAKDEEGQPMTHLKHVHQATP